MDRADRQKLILLVLLIVLVGYLGYNGVAGFTGVRGLQEEAAKLEKERNDLRQQVDSATAMVANLDRIKREREQLTAQLQEISRRLPGEHESGQVLRSVETLAGKSGLTTVGVRRRPSRSQELYVEIPVEITISGGYFELLKFADGLSQLPRLVNLNELRVQTASAGQPGTPPAQPVDGPGTMRATMVSVVYQALPGPATASPAPETPATGSGPAATPSPKP